MKHKWKRLLSVALTLALLSTLLVPMAGATEKRAAQSRLQRLELTPVDADGLGLLQGSVLPEDEAREAEPYRLTDTVRVSIVLERTSTIGAGFLMEDIAANTAARLYRSSLRLEQAALTRAIESAIGGPLAVKWNLTLAANMISAEVLYGQIASIRAVPGVADVIIENRYELDRVELGADKPNTGTSSVQIGSGPAWAEGYTGAGSRVAIIDTGADIAHRSFSGEGLEYALAESGADVTLMTAADIDAVASQLNSGATGAEAYINAKIPYGYNYVDGNYDVTHENDTQGNHGSHVSGIAAANRYVQVDGEWKTALSEVGVQGVAPDAQLIEMKVFGQGGGAYDSDYMAAIEDAIVLGCDSANLSLGSSVSGFAFSQGYEDVMNKLVENGLVVSFSAGNNSYWNSTPEAHPYPYLYIDDVNYATGGSPGSFTNSLTVASVDNSGQTGFPLMFGELPVFFTETSGNGNAPFTTLAAQGELEYVLVDGPGVTPLTTEDDDSGKTAIGVSGYDVFSDLGSEILSGKIAICKRGSSSFFVKANAAIAQGAIGVIIFNNRAGTISMDLSGYQYSAPVVSITQADGEAIMAQSAYVEGEQPYYTGSLTVSDTLQLLVGEAGDQQELSDFSSWGVHGSLTLKPEIAAPGGSIYSVQGHHFEGGVETGSHETYELMSGTSMASPQVAGMAAVLGQYIRDNDLEAKTGLTARQLINSLLMSTAVPIYDSYGDYWSLLGQGAGLANVGNAVNARSYILMDEDATLFPDSARDGKVKAELGDDPDATGAYEYSFTVYPLTEEGTCFHFRTDVFTQGVAGNGGYGMLQDSATMLIGADVTYTVNGETYGDYFTLDADVNRDGVTDEADAQAILDKLTDSYPAEAEFDQAAADVDGDEAVTSVDARLILESCVKQYVEITEPTPVTVSIQVDQDWIALLLGNYFTRGFYVQAYTYLEPDASGEGEILDVTHSIPMLAFCGNWSDPSMFDRTSPIGEAYGTGKLPYLGNANTNYLSIQSAADGTTRVYMGNPFTVEERFPADRLALNAEDTIRQVNFLPIRNIASYAAAVTDADGKVLWMSAVGGNRYAPYYYPNGGVWQNTSPANFTFGKTLKSLGLNEGDSVTVGFYALPEYYAIASARENGGVATSGVLSAEDFRTVLERGAVGEGAAIAYTVTVDNTAPTVDGLFLDLLSGKLTVQAKDNQYIAYVGILNKGGSREFAAAVPEQSAPGEAVTVELTPEGKLPATALLVVGDYAGNTYTATFATGAEPEDLSGNMYGFVTAATTAGPGSGDRVWQIDPATLSYNHETGDYDGISVFSPLGVSVRAAEYVDGYVYMAGSDGYFYAADIDELEDAQRVGKYSAVTDTVYDMACNRLDGQLYVLGSDNAIYTMDLLTGALTQVLALTLSEETAPANALAIDDQGVFYVASEGGPSSSKLFSFALSDATAPPPVDTVFASFDFESDPGSEEGPEPAPKLVTAELVGPMGVYNYSEGGGLAWDRNKGILYLAANYDEKQAYDHYLWVLDTETGAASRANQVGGTENDSSNTSARLYACVNGLFIVPGRGQGLQPTDVATGVEVEPASMNLLRGQTAALTATVYPWTLEDKAVSFESADESIATVTAKGEVTGLAVGSTSITVTTSAEPHLSASVPVTVEDAPVTQLRGIIWDADGHGMASVFDTDKPGDWSGVAEVGELRWGVLVDDLVYGSTEDTMYVFDADTYEITPLGGIVSQWIPSDAANVPEDMILAWGLDAGFRVGGLCNGGTYFEVLSPEAGSLNHWDLSESFSSDPMAVIAETGLRFDYVDADGDTHADAAPYFVLTESGELWLFVLDMEGTLLSEDLGPTGLTLEGVSDVTNSIWASLAYDESADFLYLAYYDGSDDVARLYAIDPNEPARNAELGDFNNAVWPVVGLYDYEPATDLVLRVKPTGVEMYETQTAQLKIKVKLGDTNAYTVSSGDASVATVDETGLITAVHEGTTQITVTTVDSNDLGEQLTGTVNVTVKPLVHPDLSVIAQISDGAGDHFAALSLADLSYVASADAPAALTAGGRGGDLYLAGMDSNYSVLNAADFTASDWDDVDSFYANFPAQDVANYPAFYDAEYGENSAYQFLFTTEIGWVVKPDYYGWNMSSSIPDMAGIAYVGEEEIDTDEDGTPDTAFYEYFVLDTDGVLYLVIINIDEGTYNYRAYLDTGITLADQADASMAWAETADTYGLVVAVNSTGAVWFIDFSSDPAGDVGFCGELPEEVTNIDGLIGDYDAQTESMFRPPVAEEPESGEGTVAESFDFRARFGASFSGLPELQRVGDGSAMLDGSEAFPSGSTELERFGSAEPVNAVGGSLNAIRGRQVAQPQYAELGTPAEDDAPETMAVELSETEASRNGLLTATYDPEVLTFVSGDSALDYCSVHDDGAGTVTFTYASVEEIAAEEVLATLKFAYTYDEDAGTRVSVTVTTAERDDDTAVSEEPTVVELCLYSEPTWSWAEDFSAATATFRLPGAEDTVLDAAVELDEEASAAPDCENAGATVYVATVTGPDGETWTDTKTETLPAIGHAWGSPVFTWAQDFATATLKLTCANDESHTLEVELEAEKERSGMTTTYTVSYELDGETYTDTRIVTKQYVQPAPKPTPTPTPQPEPELFDDADDASEWFFDAVYWAVEKGVAEPETEEHFGVASDYTRAQTVLALWKAVGAPEPTTAENPFEDVSETDVFYKAVLWGSETGVIKGVDVTHFAPDLTVTRGQAVTFLYRAAKGSVPTDAENPFEDVTADDYYYEPILWAVSLGVTEGVDATHFAPQSTLTAGHIVTFLYRLYKEA